MHYCKSKIKIDSQTPHVPNEANCMGSAPKSTKVLLIWATTLIYTIFCACYKIFPTFTHTIFQWVAAPSKLVFKAESLGAFTLTHLEVCV